MTGKQYFERGDWELNKYNGKNTREYYVFKNGTRAMMPRYYRDKIYSEKEKEFLWLQKLDNGDYRDWETDRKSTRLNSSHITRSRMPSSA